MTRICFKTELNEKVHSSVFLAFLCFVKSKFSLLSNVGTWAGNTHFREIVRKLENTILCCLLFRSLNYFCSVFLNTWCKVEFDHFTFIIKRLLLIRNFLFLEICAFYFYLNIDFSFWI